MKSKNLCDIEKEIEKYKLIPYLTELLRKSQTSMVLAMSK
jgi:hypothetical protein